MPMKKIKQILKKVKADYTGFSVSRTVLFGEKDENSNFQNFLPDLQNNPDKFLNQKHLYFFLLNPNYCSRLSL